MSANLDGPIAIIGILATLAFAAVVAAWFTVLPAIGLLWLVGWLH